MIKFITKTQIEEAAHAIQKRTLYKPVIGLELGSGLGTLAEQIRPSDVIPYSDIPHWPTSTAPGHQGQLVIGQLGGKTVLALQGRSHFYEGHSMAQITLPVRVMHLLGIRTLIVTNAAGGLNPTYKPGSLMLIRDHLNMPGLAGQNPLRGPNDDTFGPRFPDMTAPYDPALRQLAQKVAQQQGIRLEEGVYAFVSGPSYETPAELRFLQMVGADAVGMSTVPSVVVARHAQMRVLGISTITNLAIPDPTPGTILTHEEVLETGKQVVPQLMQVLRGVLQAI